MTKNEYKSLALFNDVEDLALRTRNRAVVLANIATDHTRNKLISPNGAAIILGYFQQIPEEERAAVHGSFKSNMQERGYVVG